MRALLVKVKQETDILWLLKQREVINAYNKFVIQLIEKAHAKYFISLRVVTVKMLI